MSLPATSVCHIAGISLVANKHNWLDFPPTNCTLVPYSLVYYLSG